MRTKKIGQRVKILGGMKEFIGATGTIIDMEKYSQGNPAYYRVEFDEPVYVEGIGHVTDDLWTGSGLRNIRS